MAETFNWKNSPPQSPSLGKGWRRVHMNFDMTYFFWFIQNRKMYRA